MQLCIPASSSEMQSRGTSQHEESSRAEGHVSWLIDVGSSMLPTGPRQLALSSSATFLEVIYRVLIWLVVVAIIFGNIWIGAWSTVVRPINFRVGCIWAFWGIHARFSSRNVLAVQCGFWLVRRVVIWGLVESLPHLRVTKSQGAGWAACTLCRSARLDYKTSGTYRDQHPLTVDTCISDNVVSILIPDSTCHGQKRKLVRKAWTPPYDNVLTMREVILTCESCR